jgi:hypothetical protein
VNDLLSKVIKVVGKGNDGAVIFRKVNEIK